MPGGSYAAFVKAHVNSCPGKTPQDRMRACAAKYRAQKKGRGVKNAEMQHTMDMEYASPKPGNPRKRRSNKVAPMGMAKYTKTKMNRVAPMPGKGLSSPGMRAGGVYSPGSVHGRGFMDVLKKGLNLGLALAEPFHPKAAKLGNALSKQFLGDGIVHRRRRRGRGTEGALAGLLHGLNVKIE